MAFILFNHEHNNTRGFYTATYNTMNQHIFFCTNDECGNVAPKWGALCMDCEHTHVCSGEWDYELREHWWSTTTRRLLALSLLHLSR